MLTAGQRRVARFSAPPSLPGLEPQSHQEELFSDEIIFSQSNAALAAGLARIAHLPDGSLREVHRQAAAYQDWEESAENQAKRLVANAWCAAFVWIKREDAPPAIVNRVFTGTEGARDAVRSRRRLRPRSSGCERSTASSTGTWSSRTSSTSDDEAATSTRTPAGPAGSRCCSANPPWDKVDFKDKEYFSVGRAVHRGPGRAERGETA